MKITKIARVSERISIFPIDIFLIEYHQRMHQKVRAIDLIEIGMRDVDIPLLIMRIYPFEMANKEAIVQVKGWGTTLP